MIRKTVTALCFHMRCLAVSGPSLLSESSSRSPHLPTVALLLTCVSIRRVPLMSLGGDDVRPFTPVAAVASQVVLSAKREDDPGDGEGVDVPWRARAGALATRSLRHIRPSPSDRYDKPWPPPWKDSVDTDELKTYFGGSQRCLEVDHARYRRKLLLRGSCALGIGPRRHRYPWTVSV